MHRPRWMSTVLAVGVGALLLGACATDDGAPPETAAPDLEPADPEPADDADADPGDDPVDDGADDPPPEPRPTLETVAEGLDDPWGLAFLPDGEHLLVTQNAGTLSLVELASGEVTDLDGVPAVATVGQGGLLDVEVADLGGDLRVWLTYSAGDDATTTTLAAGTLDRGAGAMVDVEVLFEAQPRVASGQHFGSRVVLGPDDHLYVSIGDRGDKTFADHVAQDRSNHLGTVVRLTPDGQVPDDNPFLDDADVLDEIFTYGHRNVQGMAVHPETGEIWTSQHGERDGDELQILQPGGNHGWPITHTGCRYGSDAGVGGDPFANDDVVDPVFFWECGTGGFPPAGMTFYDGEMFPAWQGDLFVGGLASQQLARFTVDGREVDLAETLLGDEGLRIRDVAVGPDGALYLAVDGDGVPLLRLVDGS